MDRRAFIASAAAAAAAASLPTDALAEPATVAPDVAQARAWVRDELGIDPACLSPWAALQLANHTFDPGA